MSELTEIGRRIIRQRDYENYIGNEDAWLIDKLEYVINI